MPSTPWSRTHLDSAGPTDGNYFCVRVDAYSKYPEIIKMSTITSTALLKVLCPILSRHGLPEIVVTDNGTYFVSEEFEFFCKDNGIVHLTSVVHKPSRNGQAERVVQILKTALKQARRTNTPMDDMISKYLLPYRSSPHSTTGESPSVPSWAGKSAPDWITCFPVFVIKWLVPSKIPLLELRIVLFDVLMPMMRSWFSTSEKGINGILDQ